VFVTRLKDKNGNTASDLVPPDDPELSALFRRAKATASVSQNDFASGESFVFLLSNLNGEINVFIDDDEDEDGSGSGSDED
jgi:uncharacterized protein